MLKYVKTNQTFLEQKDAGNIEDTDIVFIEDVSNIWTHGHCFCQEDPSQVGKDVTGNEFIINGSNVTAGANAEIFNDYDNNIASGKYSHAENYNTIAKGNYSHAEGYGTLASGAASHTEGTYTNASSAYQHVRGKYNEIDTNGLYNTIIGNGTSDADRRNIFTIDWDGNVACSGKITQGSQSITNDNDLISLQYLQNTLSNIQTWVSENFVLRDTQGGEIIYNGDPANPNFGTVTLTKSLSNFTYIEIFAMTDDKHVIYQKVYNPDGLKVSFNAGLVGHTNFFTKCKVYSLSGTTIETAKYGENNMAGMWGTHNPSTFERSDEYIGIYKVLGFY